MESTSTKKSVAVLLKRVIDAVERLADEDIEAVLAGDARLELSVNRKAKKEKAEGVRLDPAEVQEITQQLQQMSDRDSGFALLREKCAKKPQLIAIAEELDIPFQKKEAVERLQEKIIESTIGYRLRSRAIQGSQ